MAANLEQVYTALSDKFLSTNEINNRLRQNWSTTYGQLCLLVAQNKAEMLQIKCGRRNHIGWRRKQI